MKADLGPTMENHLEHQAVEQRLVDLNTTITEGVMATDEYEAQ